jgi:tetratricopeptide (TPR) repeat protein
LKTRSPLLLLIFLITSLSFANAQKEADIVAKVRIAVAAYAQDVPEPPTIVKGKVNLSSMSADGAVYYHMPLFRMEFEVAGMKFISVKNDSMSWTYNPVDKSHKIERVSKSDIDKMIQLDQALGFASKDLLNYKARGFKLKNLGIKKIDSIETYALQLTKKDDHVIDFYVSTRSYLIYKIQEGNEVRLYWNYRRYGDYIYPTFLASNANGTNVDLRLSEVIINATIPQDRFIIPREAIDDVKQKEAKLESGIAHADSLYNNKEYTAAIDSYNAILRNHGRVYRAYNGLGLSKLAMEKYYDAVSEFNKALEMVPTGSNALNNRGLAKYYIGDNKGALEDFNASIASDSLQVSAYSNRGLLHFNEENYEAAAIDYANAIRLRPDHPEYLYSHGIAIAQLEQYEEALRDYRKAMSLGFEPAGIFNYAGVAYFKLEKYDSAGTLFKKALTLEKNNSQYIENYANSLYYLGEYDGAMEQFETCLKIKDDDAETYNMIGLCKYQLEDYKGAISKFSKAIELAPKTAVYYDNRASARENIDDYEGAISDYSQSISIYPNDAEIFFSRGMLKIRTSKKLEGCMDLGTANEMKHEGAKEAIIKNCN